jgi:predicted transcriptional regulator
MFKKSEIRLAREVREVALVETALRAGETTTRLSLLERGLVEPRPGEIERILAAVEEIAAERGR